MLKQRVNRRNMMIAAAVVLAALAALLITVLVLTQARLFKPDRAMYQYFGNQRFDYPKNTQVVLGKSGTELRYNGITAAADTTPVYYTDMTGCILPSVMSWVSPYTGREEKAAVLSQLICEDDHTIRLVQGSESAVLENGFLYDGKDTYIFLDDMNIQYDGREYDAGRLSFAVVTAQGQIRLYCWASGEYTLDTAATGEVTAAAASGAYSISLVNDTMTMADGQEKLLFVEPDLLEAVIGS